MLPLACALTLLAFAAIPPVQQNPRLLWSFLGTGAGLLAWTLVLLALPPSRRGFSFEVALRPQHYVQACAHASILVYWGWFWRPVYDYAYLIVAQLVFAYAFDALLTWSRGERFTLGFGPFPIVFSTNLFLWFKPEWFFLQFLMLAVGFSAKALIRWNRDGRETHIFNPSAFTLTVFSSALLVTGTTGITWGQDIAVTQFFPPHIYTFLFLVALPGQLLFGVTTMTMSAVVTTYAFGLGYFALTGTYYFFDSYIPIAVFLGMHLLFTDPSTAPRTEGGRIIFGALYGLEYRRPVRVARHRRAPDLLRQAAAGAAVEPVGQGDRLGGAIDAARSHGSGPGMARGDGETQESGVRLGVGGGVSADERRRGRRRHSPRPVAALLAGRLRRRPPGRVPPPGADVRNLLPRRLSVVVPRVHVDGPGCG